MQSVAAEITSDVLRMISKAYYGDMGTCRLSHKEDLLACGLLTTLKFSAEWTRLRVLSILNIN